MERLWTPWRMNYVTGSSEPESAQDRSQIFVRALDDASNPDSLIVHRGEHAFVIMNLFPYNSGHMMVVPNRQTQSLDQLSVEERSELMELTSWAADIASRVLRCDGLNIGLNIGAVGGAGIADHLHIHVVPRWLGDANFMPVTAGTMVLPELLPATTARIKGEFLADVVARGNGGTHSTAGALVFIPEANAFVVREAGDGTLVIPKGHIEDGETAADAAIREVHEETGYRATITNWGGAEFFEHKDRRFHAIYFLGTAVATEEVEGHLASDTIMLTPNEVCARLSFDGLRQIAERARGVFEI